MTSGRTSTEAPDRAGPSRRRLLAAGLLAPWWAAARADEAVRAALRRGGVVVAFRHALAPGTFDPEGFRLDDCSTQRNLNDEGRAQARRIGDWFRSQGLVPARVRSSPWCRCVDTATLAFGRAERWAALSSPHGTPAGERAPHLAELRQALAAVPAGRFEAWVTHQFVLQDLAGTSTSSAEALVLRADAGAVAVLARATLY
jgi:phosphohistidine phosphatase SixA